MLVNSLKHRGVAKPALFKGNLVAVRFISASKDPISLSHHRCLLSTCLCFLQRPRTRTILKAYGCVESCSLLATATCRRYCGSPICLSRRPTSRHSSTERIILYAVCVRIWRCVDKGDPQRVAFELPQLRRLGPPSFVQPSRNGC